VRFEASLRFTQLAQLFGFQSLPLQNSILSVPLEDLGNGRRILDAMLATFEQRTISSIAFSSNPILKAAWKRLSIGA
jgi:hypothetical protein